MSGWERHLDAAGDAATGERLDELCGELAWLAGEFPELRAEAATLESKVRGVIAASDDDGLDDAELVIMALEEPDAAGGVLTSGLSVRTGIVMSELAPLLRELERVRRVRRLVAQGPGIRWALA